MAKKVRLTNFARFFIFLIIVVPLAYLGASYINDEDPKENINKLKKFGYKIIGPEVGDMACGEYGEGKMMSPDKIIKEIKNYFSNYKSN